MDTRLNRCSDSSVYELKLNYRRPCLREENELGIDLETACTAGDSENKAEATAEGCASGASVLTRHQSHLPRVVVPNTAGDDAAILDLLPVPVPALTVPVPG